MGGGGGQQIKQRHEYEANLLSDLNCATGVSTGLESWGESSFYLSVVAENLTTVAYLSAIVEEEAYVDMVLR